MSLRRAWVTAIAPLLAYAGACATSGETARPDDVEPAADAQVDGGAPVSGDAATEADADTSAPLTPPCSPAGWCATTLPDPRPTFEDLWPVPNGAFAVDRDNGIFAFESKGSSADARWTLINQEPGALDAVWAPNVDEVWAGGDAGRVVHGTRAGDSWTWSTDVIADSERVVAIWGAGPADVFVLSTHRLYRRTTQGWHVELEKHGDAVLPECGDTSAALALGTFSFRRIVGTSADDMWIIGRKNVASAPIFPNTYCDYLVHKSGAHYETVSDCEIHYTGQEPFGHCELGPKAGVLHTWIDDSFSVVPGRIVTHWQGPFHAGPGRWARIERGLDGGYEVSSAETEVHGPSVWGPSESVVYVGSAGRVHASAQLWDGGPFEISSVALNGVPLTPTFKVRGRSADDVWAIGGTYVLHKTQP